MSHGVLDSISHVAAAGFLAYRIVTTPLSEVAQVPMEYQMKEQTLHVCGAIAAALANLNDTWQEATGPERKQLEDGYHSIAHQIDDWRTRHLIPTTSECEAIELYRLDGADAPRRRVNWSYRLVATREH